jgi:hypothetical protein
MTPTPTETEREQRPEFKTPQDIYNYLRRKYPDMEFQIFEAWRHSANWLDEPHYFLLSCGDLVECTSTSQPDINAMVERFEKQLPNPDSLLLAAKAQVEEAAARLAQLQSEADRLEQIVKGGKG